MPAEILPPAAGVPVVYGSQRKYASSRRILPFYDTLLERFIFSHACDITQKGYEKKRSKLIRAYVPHAAGMEGPLSHRPPSAPPPRLVSIGDALQEPETSDTDQTSTRRRLHGRLHSSRPVAALLRLLVRLRGGGGARRRPVGIGALEPPVTARPRPPGVHFLLLLVHSERRERERQPPRRLSRPRPPVSPGTPHVGLQQSLLSQSHHGIGHLSLKRKGALSVAENGGSLRRSCEFGSDMLWPPPLESDENHSAPPDVTGYSSDSPHSHTERHHMSNMGTIARNTQKYGNAERMETGDGVFSVHKSNAPVYVAGVFSVHKSNAPVYVAGVFSVHKSNTPVYVAGVFSVHKSNAPVYVAGVFSVHKSNAPFYVAGVFSVHKSNAPVYVAGVFSVHKSNVPVYVAGVFSVLKSNAPVYVAGVFSVHKSNVPVYVAGVFSVHKSNAPVYVAGVFSVHKSNVLSMLQES
ncbi:hypothetical protein WMY93_029956 [Mugilogobius chulae]|uniref:DMAP1-binding domain-containing protein n=1 Tax=Mugilogobius chulae TaxID=88201 RepID=A0AAW0MWE8_9GOBI